MSNRFQFAALLLVFQIVWLAPVRCEENDKLAADGPWISSLAWLNNQEVAGTSSQGLLLRPAQLVKASIDSLGNLATLGEAETSLWSVQALDGDKAIATDYKGGIHLFGDGDAKKFEVESRWIRALAKSPNTNEILAGTEDGKLLVLSLEQMKEVRRVDVAGTAIFDIALSHAGDKLAIACGDGTIKLYSWPKLELQGQMSRGSEAVWSVLFSADDQQLISGGSDRRMLLWTVAGRQLICTLARTGDWVTDMVALPNSTLVAAACMDGNVVVADTASMQKVASIAGPGSPIWCMALSPDATRLMVGTRKKGLALVDFADWQSLAKQTAEEASKIRPPSPKKG